MAVGVVAVPAEAATSEKTAALAVQRLAETGAEMEAWLAEHPGRHFGANRFRHVRPNEKDFSLAYFFGEAHEGEVPRPSAIRGS